MGDGYTTAEEPRFFDDIQRLTNDMFTGDTFTQYLPLFNVWAVFVPSAQSGIGVGGKPLDTAFGLYRDGTELRGVYTSKPQYARDVCKTVGPFACDFPSLIGNDDFYGGLGGPYVISTRSPTSGTVVLRHEMGHSFGNVGDEYDGSYAYYGANSAPSVTSITWKHWLTNPAVLREEKAVQRYQKHIWYDLKQGAYQIKFTSNGAFKRYYILLSISGADTDDSLTVTLDGQPLPWKTKGVKDRMFYDWKSSEAGFSSGDHVLEIKAGGSFDSPIIKQLCNAVIYEYGDESEFKKDDPNYIGVYPTWDLDKKLTYRPNNERCLMRNMTSPKFCAVCQENMWQQFMSRITFIDDVVVSGTKVEAKLIPLGQLRPGHGACGGDAPPTSEKYAVQWFNGETEVKAFRDQFKIDVSTVAGATAKWTVKVQFTTPSVRLDSNNVMQSERNFTILLP
ncbi:Aste57867_6350 [Aphanomyces stellatus]|uniref:Aste57867_6350 protein n=1 Tax=Aphanomyces stellatus TaxID=120398 RepID=A0A485KE52_9STRA|nr:hypothetical protein As57867_006336 [Aphanomyces stellatus]VFT83347.1 Aste57867_6350 [Aphanomyces stellatus]